MIRDSIELSFTPPPTHTLKKQSNWKGGRGEWMMHRRIVFTLQRINIQVESGKTSTPICIVLTPKPYTFKWFHWLFFVVVVFSSISLFSHVFFPFAVKMDFFFSIIMYAKVFNLWCCSVNTVNVNLSTQFKTIELRLKCQMCHVRWWLIQTYMYCR